VACAARFIDAWVARAWRRPLLPDERAALERVYATGAAGGGLARGIELVLQVALQSTQFLYRIEIGARDLGRTTSGNGCTARTRTS
jgi:hypothetical protein